MVRREERSTKTIRGSGNNPAACSFTASVSTRDSYKLTEAACVWACASAGA